MTAAAYRQVIAAGPRDRLDLFLETANRLGAPVGNVDKDFWVCWALNALYCERPAGGPRLLFKGGTSLSKAYGLIRRFSEDIDMTVFRDDLDEQASVEELEALSNRKRRQRLDAIRDACRAYISGPLRKFLAAQLTDAASGAGRVEIDGADPDGQTLLVWYPEVEPREDTYVRPSVRIESGAKSALDPHRSVTIQPYIAEDAAGLNLSTGGVTVIDAARTFWDKVVIAHGLRRWHERRGVPDRNDSVCRGTTTTCIVCSVRTLAGRRSRIGTLVPIVSGTLARSSTAPTTILRRPSQAPSQSRRLT